MKRSLAVLITLLLCLSAGIAQDWAKQKLDKSPRHGEWVQIKHDNRTVQAFVVYPETKAKAPVVIVIHEIFGLSDWARSVADQLAANGYIAIAPDLLSGMGPKGGGTSEFASTQDAVKAISGLNPDQVTADLNATADYAKKIPAGNGKLAVSGFCWGGGQSFRFATNRKDLSAAFVLYGPGPENVSAITAPVYGFYAGEDARIGLAHHLPHARHHAFQLPTQPLQQDLPPGVSRPLDAVADLRGEAFCLSHHPAGCLQ